MSLTSSLYVGTSGLQTSQNAMNTTAHNLTNTDTTGYTRQQALFASRDYFTIAKNPSIVSDKQIGLGVNYADVRQVRDYFLDKTYREEAGRSSFYDVSSNCLSEIETLLGELNGEDFQTSLSDLWVSISELAKDPGSSVTQGLLVQRATQFIERATNVYGDLCNYQDNMNKEVADDVKAINKYGEQILLLNDQIRLIESGGVEGANDLRDIRNSMLDELSKLTNISYGENLDKTVWVKIEGTDFVRGDNCYEIGLHTDKETGFHTPFWLQDATATTLPDGTVEYDISNAEVFDMSREVSTALNTDVGGLRATLLARGDHRADSTDMKNYDDISESIIMNVQAEFDQLINHVVTKINEIMADASDPATGYMCNEDGTPLQLFMPITPEASTAFTLKNVKVNEVLQQSPAKLSFTKADGTVDYETAEKLLEAFEESAYTLNPDVIKTTNFVNYYTDLVSQVANSGYVYRSILQNQEVTVETTLNAREQIVGVSQDEELANMIKFQNAYNAASRYITVIDTMLEHIIQTLAM